MKKLILTFVIVLSCTGLHAYTVSGRITDSGTGLSVKRASVAIEELKIVQVTAEDGLFVFKDIPVGYYTVHVAHTLYGNKTVLIRVKRNFIIDIDLPGKTYSIMPLVNSYKENETRTGSQSISQDDIMYMPMSGAGDSLHLLQSLPGVSGSFSISGVPVIRGLNPIYDKIYIDDIPVDYPYHYIPPVVPLLSSINETVIDKATIYKGPYPMTYDDSIGSIIHVKTKEVENPGVHGKIILNPLLPLFPTIYCEAAPTADFSLLFAGRRTYIDMAYKAVQIESSNTFYFQDYFLKMRYNYLKDHRFYITAMGSDDYVSIKKYNAKTEYHIEEFKWDYLINRKFFLETSFIRNSVDHHFTDKKGDTPVRLVYSPLAYTLKQTLNSDISVFDVKTGYEFIIHQDGVSGNIDISEILDYDILKTTGVNSYVAYPIEGKTVSLFNETGVDLKPVHLNFGIRYKHYGPLSCSSVSYRGMASYTIQSYGFKIYAGGGENHAQPDMYYYLGNNTVSLKESRSYNMVLGLEKSLSREITGQVETYYTKYQDLFSLNSAGDVSPMLRKLAQINPYSKDESGTALGAECFIKGRLGPVYGWTSYSLSKSRMSDGDTEYYSDYDQTHIFKIALLTHKGGWTPSVVWSFATSMPYTPIIRVNSDESAEYGGYNSKRYGAHHKLDFKLSYADDNIRYYAEIWDVYYIKGYDQYDNELITNKSYIYPVLDNKRVKNQADIPGAFFWLGMEICF